MVNTVERRRKKKSKLTINWLFKKYCTSILSTRLLYMRASLKRIWFLVRITNTKNDILSLKEKNLLYKSVNLFHTLQLYCCHFIFASWTYICRSLSHLTFLRILFRKKLFENCDAEWFEEDLNQFLLVVAPTKSGVSNTRPAKYVLAVRVILLIISKN